MRALTHRLKLPPYRLTKTSTGSSAVQPWHSTQLLLFMPAHQEKMPGPRFCCWSLQKPCIGVVSIGEQKQTQMMIVHQNILSSVMLKKVKLCYGNVRFQLTTPEICQARNLCSCLRTAVYSNRQLRRVTVLIRSMHSWWAKNRRTKTQEN